MGVARQRWQEWKIQSVLVTEDAGLLFCSSCLFFADSWPEISQDKITRACKKREAPAASTNVAWQPHQGDAVTERSLLSSKWRVQSRRHRNVCQTPKTDKSKESRSWVAECNFQIFRRNIWTNSCWRSGKKHCPLFIGQPLCGRPFKQQLTLDASDGAAE